MAPDTRTLLRTGLAIFLTGAIAAALMYTVFGGISRQGPHTNGGWLCLMLAHRQPRSWVTTTSIVESIR